MHYTADNLGHRTWRSAWLRGLALLLSAIALLCSGCGGKDAPSEAATRGGAGAALGSADATLTGASSTSAPSRRPESAGVATATQPPSGASAARADTPATPARTGATPSSTRGGATPSPASGARAAAATPHPDTPNPCTLVTAAEAETALGGRPFPGSMRRSRDSAEVRCTYDYFANGEMGSVVLSLWKGSEAKPVYDLRRSAYGQGATIEEIRGLGDRAFTVKGDEGWINILKGDLYISIQVERQGLSAQDQQSRAMTLARTVLGRL